MGKHKKTLLTGEHRKSSIEVEEAMKNIGQYREMQNKKLSLGCEYREIKIGLKHKRTSAIPLKSFKRAKKIIQLFEKDKIYLNRNLRVQHLSEKLRISIYTIHKDLRINFNKNFNSILTYYRILFFLENTNKSDFIKYTYDYIATQSGYNSNHIHCINFKKLTGISVLKYNEMIFNETLPENFITEFKMKHKPFND